MKEQIITKTGASMGAVSAMAIPMDTITLIISAMVGALLIHLNIHSDERKKSIREKTEYSVCLRDIVIGVFTGGFMGWLIASIALPVIVLGHVQVGDLVVEDYKVYIAGLGGFLSPYILDRIKTTGSKK